MTNTKLKKKIADAPEQERFKIYPLFEGVKYENRI
jgi:hypothetical protein